MLGWLDKSNKWKIYLGKTKKITTPEAQAELIQVEIRIQMTECNGTEG